MQNTLIAMPFNYNGAITMKVVVVSCIEFMKQCRCNNLTGWKICVDTKATIKH